MNHSTKIIEIKVVRGTILPEDNEIGGVYALFYWANFVPHYDGKTVLIIGECGFDPDFEKKSFVFTYNCETDTASFDEKYRMSLCSPEIYNKYYLNIQYTRPQDGQTLAIPWIRFPRSKDGIAIPQLVQQILGKIPTKMTFL